jgi:calcium-dependent protein kinase
VDGSSPPPPPITDVFTLGRVLGRGAFGVTRLAKERATGQSAAVKTIARRRIAAIMPDGAERVRSEVEAMRRVAGHPHIVSLKSCHEDEKGVHLAMVRDDFFFIYGGREREREREREG